MNKKIMALLLLHALPLATVCMEQEQSTHATASLAGLPAELKAMIASSIKDSKDLKEIFSRLARMALINRSFADIAKDEFVRKQIIKEFKAQHPGYSALNELMGAVETNNSKLIEALLDYAGIDVNETDASQWTPLMHAAVGSKAETIKTLLARGANVHSPKPGRTGGALSIAASSIADNPEILDLLVKAGADINEKDKDDNTPLMRAAARGLTNNAKYLINAGADLRAVNSHYRSALQIAQFTKHDDIAKLIEDALTK